MRPSVLVSLFLLVAISGCARAKSTKDLTLIGPAVAVEGKTDETRRERALRHTHTHKRERGGERRKGNACVCGCVCVKGSAEFKPLHRTCDVHEEKKRQGLAIPNRDGRCLSSLSLNTPVPSR
jgi:hypothetical protein